MATASLIAGPRRAFRGLDWRAAGMVAAACAIWTLGITAIELPGHWEEGEMTPYLVFIVGGTFFSALLTALAMGLPLLVVGNLGPQAGWRRVMAFVMVLPLVGLLGAILRRIFLVIINDVPWPPLDEIFVMLCFRYMQQAALLVVLAEFHRHGQRHLRAIHEAELERLGMEREMAEARLQVLQAQIEPHFLFNTLANVRRLYQTDAPTGRRMLDDLMRYLETALPCMRASTSTVEREVGLVTAYLGVQSVRMGRRLAYEIDVPPALGPLALPSMMLLTLVENAIKHGLNPLPEGGSIQVRARRDGDRLRLAVIDDGGGFRASAGGGTGLANIRARLAMLHHGAGRLSLLENESRGVTSMLELPAQLPAEAAVA
jgi:signal transduction histidine kinase